jgi:hypothetical protein
MAINVGILFHIVGDRKRLAVCRDGRHPSRCARWSMVYVGPTRLTGGSITSRRPPIGPAYPAATVAFVIYLAIWHVLPKVLPIGEENSEVASACSPQPAAGRLRSTLSVRYGFSYVSALPLEALHVPRTSCFCSCCSGSQPTCMRFRPRQCNGVRGERDRGGLASPPRSAARQRGPLQTALRGGHTTSRCARPDRRAYKLRLEGQFSCSRTRWPIRASRRYSRRSLSALPSRERTSN